MSRLALLFVAVCLTVVALAESKDAIIPSYIEICKRNDPHVEDCILNSVEKIRPKLLEGIPELDVPVLDPLLIPEVKVAFGSPRTAGFRAVGHNVLVHGAKDFKISKLKVDLESDPKFMVGIEIPELYFIADYDINAQFAMLPLKGRGPIHANASGISGDIVLNGKLVERDGNQYMQFGSTEVDLKISDFKVTIENLFRGDTILTEATNAAINGNSQEFLQSLLPLVERTVGNVILEYANKITKNLNYNEIFPKD